MDEPLPVVEYLAMLVSARDYRMSYTYRVMLYISLVQVPQRLVLRYYPLIASTRHTAVASWFLPLCNLLNRFIYQNVLKPLNGPTTGVVVGAGQLPNEVMCSLTEIGFERVTS